MYLDAADDDPLLETGPAVELDLSIVDQKYGVNHFRRNLGSFDTTGPIYLLFGCVRSILADNLYFCCRGGIV
jgi:hypothetical protein